MHLINQDSKCPPIEISHKYRIIVIIEYYLNSMQVQRPSLQNIKKIKLQDYQIGRILAEVLIRLQRQIRQGKLIKLNKSIANEIKGQSTYYALKMLKKYDIIKARQMDHVYGYNLIYSQISHPFIVGIEGFAQDSRYIYLVLELINGRQLFSYIRKVKVFNTEQSKFYAATITLIFQYLHGKNIIYRDLKRQNLLIGVDGYLKLGDFGFAKIINEVRTFTICGTPQYLAPQIILIQGHGKAVGTNQLTSKLNLVVCWSLILYPIRSILSNSSRCKQSVLIISGIRQYSLITQNRMNNNPHKNYSRYSPSQYSNLLQLLSSFTTSSIPQVTTVRQKFSRQEITQIIYNANIDDPSPKETNIKYISIRDLEKLHQKQNVLIKQFSIFARQFLRSELIYFVYLLPIFLAMALIMLFQVFNQLSSKRQLCQQLSLIDRFRLHYYLCDHYSVFLFSLYLLNSSNNSTSYFHFRQITVPHVYFFDQFVAIQHSLLFQTLLKDLGLKQAIKTEYMLLEIFLLH